MGRLAPAQGLCPAWVLRKCLWNWAEICVSLVCGFLRGSVSLSKGKCPIQRHIIQLLGESHFGGLPGWPHQHPHVDSRKGSKPQAAPPPASSTDCSGTIEGAALVWGSERQNDRTVGSPREKNRSLKGSGILKVFEKQPHPSSMRWTLWKLRGAFACHLPEVVEDITMTLSL